MFWFFSSKNKKLVRQWRKEHKKIVLLANTIVAEYGKNNQKAVKKALSKLTEVAATHLMEEDIGLDDLVKDIKRNTPEIESSVAKFKDNFKELKKTLINFLVTYSNSDAVIDKTFFETFKSIVSVLSERIEFEENNLYAQMEK